MYDCLLPPSANPLVIERGGRRGGGLMHHGGWGRVSANGTPPAPPPPPPPSPQGPPHPPPRIRWRGPATPPSPLRAAPRSPYLPPPIRSNPLHSFRITPIPPPPQSPGLSFPSGGGGVVRIGARQGLPGHLLRAPLLRRQLPQPRRCGGRLAKGAVFPLFWFEVPSLALAHFCAPVCGRPSFQILKPTNMPRACVFLCTSVCYVMGVLDLL